MGRSGEIGVGNDRAQQWLNAHRSDVPLRDKKAERRKWRMERAERQRTTKRNAVVEKRKTLIGHGRNDVEPYREAGPRLDLSLKVKPQNEHAAAPVMGSRPYLVAFVCTSNRRSPAQATILFRPDLGRTLIIRPPADLQAA
jgi:hypothetical protein